MKLKVGMGLLLTVVLVIIIGTMLASMDPETIHWDDMAISPDSRFWFGTDVMGRDLFVRTIYGGVISLMVALTATLVSVLIGVSYGLVSGFLGGRWDAVMMRFVDVLYALPFLFLVILLLVFFGQHLLLLFAAIGGYVWLDMARVVRGQTMSIRNLPYVESALVIGQTQRKVIWYHVLPQLKGVVITQAALMVPQVIMIESFLSFLGLGVQEPLTSWGALISEGAEHMSLAPWGLVIPALFLSATLIGFNLVGDGLRERWDPGNRT